MFCSTSSPIDIIYRPPALPQTSLTRPTADGLRRSIFDYLVYLPKTAFFKLLDIATKLELDFVQFRIERTSQGSISGHFEF